MTKHFTHYAPKSEMSEHLTDHPDTCACLPACRLEDSSKITDKDQNWRVTHTRLTGDQKIQNRYHTKGDFSS